MNIKMKNRTVVGVICIVLAVAVTFLVAPLLNRLSEDTVQVIRLAENVGRGVRIENSHLEVVEVKKDTVPDGILGDGRKIVGRYAADALHAGDYLYADSLTDTADRADDVFAGLDGSKIAVSVNVSGFAAGLSNKLENADVVSLIVTRSNGGSTSSSIPGALQYMRVITATTSGGLDRDEVSPDESGQLPQYSTVTFLVTEAQAKLLTTLSKSGATLTAALVYRTASGDRAVAEAFWAKQDKWLIDHADKLTLDFSVDLPETTAPSEQTEPKEGERND